MCTVQLTTICFVFTSNAWGVTSIFHRVRTEDKVKSLVVLVRFGGMPQEMFIFKGSEMPLPPICKEQGNSLINQNKEER